MSNRLHSCPYPLPHREQRECVYCDKAVKYKVEDLPSLIIPSPITYGQPIFFDNLPQQSEQMPSTASRMATAEELLQAGLVTINQGNQLIQGQFNANLANHWFQSAAGQLQVQQPSQNSIIYQGIHVSSSPYIPDNQAWILPSNEVITTPNIFERIGNWLIALIP